MADPTRHPDEATWEQLALGEIDGPARDAWFDHITTCEPCTQVWRGLQLLKVEAEGQGLIARHSARSWWMPLAAAATIVLAVGGFLLTRPTIPDAAVVRSPAALASIDGLMMAYDPQGIPTLVWPPVAAAISYRVEVFAEDGRPVWSTEATAPPVRWPAETPRTKAPYRWRVEAHGANGPIARSRLTPMEIER